MTARSSQHRTLVYCTDDAINVYDIAYGWWCLECPEGRDPETDPTNKANAERQAGRHAETGSTSWVKQREQVST